MVLDSVKFHIRVVIFAAFYVISALMSVVYAQGLSEAEGAPISARVDTDHASTLLLADKMGLAPGQTITLALAQELEKGWHVYWKNPGATGLPLSLSWTLPTGVSVGEVIYPTPERIMEGEFATFGLHGEPVFLVPLTVADDVAAGEIVEIRLDASWLICAEICVPEEATLSLSMPISNDTSTYQPGVAKVKQAKAKTPIAYKGAVQFQDNGEGLFLTLEVDETIKRFGKNLFFFPDVAGVSDPSALQPVTVRDGKATIEIAPGYDYEPGVFKAIGGVLAAKSGYRQGITFEAPVEVVAPPPKSVSAGKATTSVNLVFLFAAAFLGGVLLNLMPCVFPIVFIKAAAFLKSAQSDRATLRLHGLLYAGGVVATFAALGGALLILRAGGAQIGWGFHLQSPFVVALSAYILFLVGLNLAGLFDVGESAQRLGGAGQVGAKSGAQAGDTGDGAASFFTGVLAVVVAAPCIGPFLSAPIGAAIMVPAPIGMGIFLVMGAGLALPYLLLAFAPKLGGYLPKPGPWMVVFKQGLSFPVFGGAAFFLWVLAQQTGSAGLAAGLVGALFLSFAAWAFELSKKDGGAGLVLRALASLAVLVTIGAALSLKSFEATANLEKGSIRHGSFTAVPYDAEMLAVKRADGTPVFIDFTAAWCVACQFNKRTVFSSDALAEQFKKAGVTVMVGDWTLRDPKITKALEEFGANGVPLYVYYDPTGAATVIPLPLTKKSLLAALQL